MIRVADQKKLDVSVYHRRAYATFATARSLAGRRRGVERVWRGDEPAVHVDRGRPTITWKSRGLSRSSHRDGGDRRENRSRRSRRPSSANGCDPEEETQAGREFDISRETLYQYLRTED